MMWLLTSVLLALLSCHHSQAGRTCRFPDFMQSTGQDKVIRNWRTHLVEGGKHLNHNWEIQLTFNGDSMRADVLGGYDGVAKPNPYTRECLIEVIKGRYLVRNQEHGSSQNNTYMCMEFVQRGPDVVQMKVSKLSEHNDYRLCEDDQLEMDPWIILNKAQMHESSVTCPLHGGFSVVVYDKLTQAEVCGGYAGEIRVESECMAGEGMYFRFRHDNCVPTKLHMDKQQKVYCMASWQVDKTLYTVVRNDKAQHAWCLKFPADNNGAFHAYLYRDLRCDIPPTEEERYLRLSFRQDPPRSLADLCIDDYEACSYWSSPCVLAGSALQLTCAKRCGICSDSRPSTCTLPPGLHGRWSEQHPQGTTSLEIKDMGLSVDGLGDFRCIQWFTRPPVTDVRSYEQMFVTTFDNGCRPRYTCAHFKKHSPSVVKYKLSQSEIWPWEGTSGVSVNCDPFKYKEDDHPLGSLYRTSHLKVLLTGVSEHTYTDCDLPHDVIYFFVMYQNGSECQGRLTQDPQTKLRLDFNDCPGFPNKQTFGCLDSSRHGYLSDRIIVTESMEGGSVKVLCYMFPIDKQDTFYLLPAEECNMGAKDKISSAQLLPLATFTQLAPSTTPATTTPHRVHVDDIISMGQAGSRKDRQGDSEVESGYWVSGQDNGYKVQKLGEEAGPRQEMEKSEMDKAGVVQGDRGGSSGAPGHYHPTVLSLSACLLLALLSARLAPSCVTSSC